MTTAIALFGSFDDQPIRWNQDGENPWWVGKDLCAALKISNTSDAIASLEEDEKTYFSPSKDDIGFTAFWHSQSAQGNRQAQALVWALLTESLERRFDTAFGISRTEQEWNDRLAQQVQELERDLTRLGEAYAMEDEIRGQLTYLEQWLQERGLNPWSQPDE